VYKAVVTLAAKPGFTFSGLGADSFSYTGAATVTNAANSGTVTVTFPATAALTFTVSFTAGGGTPAPMPQSVTSGGMVALPEAMTKAGYTFSGWYRENSFTTPWNFAADTVTADTTLYAKWTAGSFTTPAQYREMVSLSGGTVTGDAAYDGPYGSGAFPPGRTVTLLNAFKMAKYETTYELWHEVYQWAAGNGYAFANAGREGNDGTGGAAPTAAKTEPVTYINWRDAIVWCNAYSEMDGKAPV
jgi:uncharacterized repeat protein (TIGR02543 family)